MIKRWIFVVALLLQASTALAIEDVYYAVSPYGTGDILSGGSPTLTISGGDGTAVLTDGGASWDHDNIGTGVEITYDGGTKAYIETITDKNNFVLITATGGVAPNITDSAVTNLGYVWATISGGVNNSQGASYLDGTPVSEDTRLHIVCFADADNQTADTAIEALWESGTDATRYIKIFTPNNSSQSCSDEVGGGFYQRHNGKWTTDGYVMDTGGDSCFDAYFTEYIYIIGLQLASDTTCIIANQGANCRPELYTIGECLITSTGPSDWEYGIGLLAAQNANNLDWTIYNTIIYGFDGGSNACGLKAYGDAWTVNIYNSTIYGCYSGIHEDSYGSPVVSVYNTLVFNCTDDIDGATVGVFCATEEGYDTGSDGVTISQTGGTPAYAALVTNAAAGDFSVTDDGSELYDAGDTDPGGADAPATDIIGIGRPNNSSAWDIGAWELFVAAAGGSAAQVINVNMN